MSSREGKKRPMRIDRIVSILVMVTALMAGALPGEETLWIEAEHLQGVSGTCWPAGPDPKTDGRWGLSGPGWAAEWTQGGESGFLSIACGPGETRAIAGTAIEIPVAGTYRVWVRYRDNREATSRFQVWISPPGRQPVLLTYGSRSVVEEDNEMKLYWDWAFAWEDFPAELPAGPARLDLLAAFPEKRCRQVDCLVLTTDPAYRPRAKERPRPALPEGEAGGSVPARDGGAQGPWGALHPGGVPYRSRARMGSRALPAARLRGLREAARPDAPRRPRAAAPRVLLGRLPSDRCEKRGADHRDERGLRPGSVRGTEAGWVVTMLNPAGQAKPQQGITPTDFRESRAVRIQCARPVQSASDWLFPDEQLMPRPLDGGSVVEIVVPAGGVRIVELKTSAGGVPAPNRPR